MRHPFFDVATPTLIGHRGCAGEVPENTLASFERGLEAGAAILESDVHRTRDGVPVLVHDDDVARVTDGTGPVRAHSFEELRRLDAGHRFSPDGRTFPFRGRGLRIPSLAQAFEAFPRARFNLELKEDLPGLVEATCDLLERTGRAERTLVTAEKDPLMERIRAEAARRALPVAIGACVGDVLGFVRAAAEGKPPAPGPMALQVPRAFDGNPLVTRPFVDHAHAHGIVVHVWTINDPDESRELAALGVDGLITDFPGRLAAALG